jgi:hypothetical protein
MSYRSYKVSTADMQDYYLPKKSSYDLMLGSINANGYGQIINNYNGPGDFSVNSYNVWDDAYGSMVVKTADLSVTYTEAQAGPALWGVDSNTGIQFLQGIISIEGLSKLKYCNSCQGRNGLPQPTITSFSNTFGYLQQMKTEYGVSEGYVFYDYDFPKNQNWYPSVMNPNSGRYVFKNYLGSNKLEEQVSTETGIPLQDITASIESAQPIKPPTITSSVIVNCCDGSTTYVIDGVYDPGSTLFTTDVRPYQCYQVTKNTSDRADNFYTWEKFGGKCMDCTTTYGSCKGR